jgi:hypothetical protein
MLKKPTPCPGDGLRAGCPRTDPEGVCRRAIAKSWRATRVRLPGARTFVRWDEVLTTIARCDRIGLVLPHQTALSLRRIDHRSCRGTWHRDICHKGIRHRGVVQRCAHRPASRRGPPRIRIPDYAPGLSSRMTKNGRRRCRLVAQSEAFRQVDHDIAPGLWSGDHGTTPPRCGMDSRPCHVPVSRPRHVPSAFHWKDLAEGNFPLA